MVHCTAGETGGAPPKSSQSSAGAFLVEGPLRSCTLAEVADSLQKDSNILVIPKAFFFS